MANGGNKQTETEEINFEMRRSFSWNRAFFTSDGVLDAEELSSMIEGGDDDVKHQLQKIEDIEHMEAELLQEIEASTQKSTGTSDVTGSSISSSSGKKDSQERKVKAASITTTRSSPCSSGSPAGRSKSSKTGKAEGDSPSKTSVGIAKRNNVVPVTTRLSRTPPASSGSSSSTFSVNQRSKRSSSVPRRSTVNSEIPSAINTRRNDECKTKKNKVTPVSAGISRTSPASPLSSGSSPSTFSVNQRSKRSSSVPRRSSVTSKKPSAINARGNDERKATKNKVAPVSTRMSRTPPASPGSSGSSSSTFSVNRRSKRSSSVPRRSSVNSEKPSAGNERSNGEWKIKNKGKAVNTGMSRTSPASPVSPGSSHSTFSVDQQSKRGSSVPRRSMENGEKPSAINATRNDEWKTSKPAITLIPKTQSSSISLKIKPPPVVSYPSSPSELFNSSSSSTTPSSSPSSSSSSTTSKVNQRSRTLKHHPTGQTPYRNGKQSAASCTESRSTKSSKTRKLFAPKTAAAVDTGSKPVSQKTNTKPSKGQSSAKAKSSTSISRAAENVILVSPEVLDIKGKLNALKMEISMQKKDKCMENKNES